MQWEHLQQQYEEYKISLLSREKLKRKEEALRKQIKHAELDVAIYDKKLENAKKALNKVKRFSFRNLFYKFTNKWGVLVEERVNALSVVKLQLHEAQQMLHELQDELIETVSKNKSIDENKIRESLKNLSKQKELWLLENSPNSVEYFNHLTEQELQYKQLQKEIQEAIDVGHKVLDALKDASSFLHEASSISSWDAYGGGSGIASYKKYELLEEYQHHIHYVRILIQRFQNELLDIQEICYTSIMIDIDGFVKFSDIFLDDILVDWNVHIKIKTAVAEVSRIEDDIVNTISELQGKLKIAKLREQDVVDKKRQHLQRK